MAHNIEANRFVAASGVGAWHGLGTELAGLTIDQACEALGIDTEEYQKVPEFYSWDGKTRPTGTYTILRPRDGKVMGQGLSAGYEIHQPKQLLECYRAICDAGDMELRTAFFLDGGKKFVACTRLNAAKSRSIDGTPEDWKVEPFGVIAGSNDGSMATRVLQQAQQVVCQNTLSIAERNTDEGRASLNLSIRHTSELTPGVIQRVQAYVSAMLANYDRKMDWLSELRATELPSDASLVFAAYLGKAPLPADQKSSYDQWVLSTAKANGRTPGAQLLREMIDRAESNRAAVVDLLAGTPTQGLDPNIVGKRKNGPATGILTAYRDAPGQSGYGSSALALQTSVTYYVDHVAGRQRGTALDSAWFGVGRNLKAQADGLLAEMLAEYSDVASAGSFRTGEISIEEISSDAERSVENFFGTEETSNV